MWTGRSYIAAGRSHERLVTQDGIRPRGEGPRQDAEDFCALSRAVQREEEWSDTRDEPPDLHHCPRLRADATRSGWQEGPKLPPCAWLPARRYIPPQGATARRFWPRRVGFVPILALVFTHKGKREVGCLPK